MEVKKGMRLIITFLGLVFLLAACQGTVSHPLNLEKSGTGLAQINRWQIQYTGELDLDVNVDVFNLDLFDTPRESILELQARGVYVICYLSAGTYEEWRPDAMLFPETVLGQELQDWPGERWLDIRQIEILTPLMENRLDLAVEKGCDGVDPDNIDGFENQTGFLITAEDQLLYNKYLSQAAHSRGLAIGLKNDLNQIPELVSYFDWIVSEECFTYQECELLLPFVEMDKPVFVLEYELPPELFCKQANQQGFMAIYKNIELDAYYYDCHQIPMD